MPTPWPPRASTVGTRGIGAIGSRREATRWRRATETAPAREAPPEGPRFGLATATFVVVSSMIGTGVLTTSGFTVYFVGSNQLMLALWVVGGVVALCGALTLCRAVGRPAAVRGRLRLPVRGVRPAGGLPVGLGLVPDRLRRADRGLGVGLGEVPAGPAAAGGTPSAAVAQPAVASVAILALAVVHCLGPRPRRSGSQGGMTAAEDRHPRPCWPSPAWRPAGATGRTSPTARRSTSSLLVTMVSSLVYISYAYTGWNAASYLAGEVEQPAAATAPGDPAGDGPGAGPLPGPEHGLCPGPVGRRRPRRSSAGPENMSSTRSRRSPRSRPSGSTAIGVADPLSVAIGLTLLASVSAYILTGPRVAYAMARAGQFPAIAGRLSPRTGTPAIATALQVAWSLVLLWTGSFERILRLLRRRPGDLLDADGQLRLRPPPAPARPAAAVPDARLSGRRRRSSSSAPACSTAAVFYERPVVSSVSLLSIAAGVPVYYPLGRRRPARPCRRVNRLPPSVCGSPPSWQGRCPSSPAAANTRPD